MTSRQWKSGKETNVGSISHRKKAFACLRPTQDLRVVFYHVLCNAGNCTVSAVSERCYHLQQHCHFKPWILSLNHRFRNKKPVSNCCKMSHGSQVLPNPAPPYSGESATDIWGSLVKITTAENSLLQLFIFLSIKFTSSKLREFQASRFLFPTNHFISLCEFFVSCCLCKNGSQGWLCSCNCTVFVYGMWDWKL